MSIYATQYFPACECRCVQREFFRSTLVRYGASCETYALVDEWPFGTELSPLMLLLLTRAMAGIRVELLSGRFALGWLPRARLTCGASGPCFNW